MSNHDERAQLRAKVDRCVEDMDAVLRLLEGLRDVPVLVASSLLEPDESAPASPQIVTAQLPENAIPV